MSVPISYYGALFREGQPITPGIARAANVAKTYGVALIKARTPVDKNVLRPAWQAKLEDSGIRFINPTPYAGWVEMGTRKMSGRHMLADSLPDINNMFRQQLIKELVKDLDLVSTDDPPSYPNAVKPTNPDKHPKVGSEQKPRPKSAGGLGKRKYSKEYLFANPKEILNQRAKDIVNAARPRWQKNASEPYNLK